MPRNLIYCLLYTLIFVSCKETPVQQPAGNEIISLVFNKGTVSALNAERKEVVVDIADFIDRRALIAIFQLSEGAIATVNGVRQYSSDTPNDFTNPVTYRITSSDGRSADWTVRMQSNNRRIGLGNVVTEEKRLVKEYEWYVAQDGTGSGSKVNGAFACVAMALKWVDIFKYNSIDVASMRGTGPAGPVDPEAVDRQFTSRNIFFKLITLSKDPLDVTEHIDRGNLVILLTDFSVIPYNELEQQYTNRFYPLLDKTISTTGHWILVKGYKKVDGILYYETYDPFSKSEVYDNGEPKGRNRYYAATYVTNGLFRANGWPYAFVIDKRQAVSTEILRNEVYLPYYKPPFPDPKDGYIPKLGTLVSIAFGY
ncbi:hypothetical protein ACFSJU_06900 [Paradesertivirga mongoliensis]|uniref:Uncharacterized protein n=1 Tax=Paradesertivirga mongoliensis TaxID=2100740 RepID=A0ABW4ZK30_9SPHI|nr:hypothetical protein [Pedobacter mongoliensis]